MPLAIFIGINATEARSFIQSKGKLVPHGDGFYLLREIHQFRSKSFADRKSETLIEHFVAELRPCPPDAAKPPAAPDVLQRIEQAFDRNEFTMRQI
jgi:hypothetical protein